MEAKIKELKRLLKNEEEYFERLKIALLSDINKPIENIANFGAINPNKLNASAVRVVELRRMIYLLEN